jgi:hypothetical protein
VLVPRPDFVQDHEAARGRVVEDVGGLGHLHHEGGLSCGEFVACADAREDAVYQADFGVFGGHETTDVRHQHNQRVLANVGGVVANEALRDVVMVRLNIQVVDDGATGFNADDGIVEVALHQKQLQLLAVDVVFPTVLN